MYKESRTTVDNSVKAIICQNEQRLYAINATGRDVKHIVSQAH